MYKNEYNNKNFDLKSYIICEICLEEYNDKERKPMLMECGHSICKICLKSILSSKNSNIKKCPFDKINFKRLNIDNYSINYTLLSIVTQYQNYTHNINSLNNIKIIENDEGKYTGQYIQTLNGNILKNGYGELIYKDGSIYYGEFKNDKKHGKGKYTYTDGKIYDGYWENNLPNGQGIFKFSSGEIDYYEGNWRDGKCFGFGKIVYNDNTELETIFLEDMKFIDIIKRKTKDGSIFYGQIDQTTGELINNKGYMISVEGNIYIGSFLVNKELVNFKKNGDNFIVYFKNGNKYYGPVINDIIKGKGKIEYKNGDIYNGDVLNGLKTGKGIINYKDGGIFEGNFENDKKSGPGKYIKGNYSYDGLWVNDLKEGNGVESFENGETYCGDFKNNKKNGNGVYLFNNGNTYKGEWKDDKMNGKGIIISKDGGEIEGKFSDGMLLDDKNNKKYCIIF